MLYVSAYNLSISFFNNVALSSCSFVIQHHRPILSGDSIHDFSYSSFLTFSFKLLFSSSTFINLHSLMCSQVISVEYSKHILHISTFVILYHRPLRTYNLSEIRSVYNANNRFYHYHHQNHNSATNLSYSHSWLSCCYHHLFFHQTCHSRYPLNHLSSTVGTKITFLFLFLSTL